MKRPIRSLPPTRQRMPRRAAAPVSTTLHAPAQTPWQRRAQWLRNHPVVVIMETAGLVGLIFAVGLFVYELRERQDERTTRAWQLVTTPASGNSGKREALHYLNSQYGCLPEGYTLPLIGRCWKNSTSLTGIDLSQPEGKPSTFLREVDLSNADLSFAVLTGVQFRDAYLKDSNLYGADLSAAYMFGADMSGADLSFANLSKTDLTSVDLSGSQLTETYFHSAHMFDVDLSGAYLGGANLSYSYLSSADLSSADLIYADLSNTNLSEANLSDADLTYTELSGADLSNTNLVGANLSYSNFSGADLTNVDMSNSTLTGLWAYDGAMPINAPADVMNIIATRYPTDVNWPKFVNRIMREQPALGWTDEGKFRNPD